MTVVSRVQWVRIGRVSHSHQIKGPCRVPGSELRAADMTQASLAQPLRRCWSGAITWEKPALVFSCSLAFGPKTDEGGLLVTKAGFGDSSTASARWAFPRREPQ